MNDIHTEAWDMLFSLPRKNKSKTVKKTHLSQARTLLSLEETPLVGIRFWNRTYPHVRLWSRSGVTLLFVRFLERGGDKCKDRGAFG